MYARQGTGYEMAQATTLPPSVVPLVRLLDGVPLPEVRKGQAMKRESGRKLELCPSCEGFGIRVSMPSFEAYAHEGERSESWPCNTCNATGRVWAVTASTYTPFEEEQQCTRDSGGSNG